MGFQNGDNKVAYTLGLIGGICQWMMNIQLPTDFWSKLFESAITAAVCGFVGIAGKELYKVARRALIAYFFNRKNRKK